MGDDRVTTGLGGLRFYGLRVTVTVMVTVTVTVTVTVMVTVTPSWIPSC